MTREIRPITGDGTGEGVRQSGGPEGTREKTIAKQSKTKRERHGSDNHPGI